ncbi:MAG: arsenic resistance N-acetyltransferase ArsN2, partial [Noviherbaspirillum sp.]
VIACVGLEVCGPDALLRSLAVAHMHRGGGFGARMTSAIEEHARQQGITRLYLLTTTAADFFERDAYQPIDRAGAPPAIQATSQFSTLCPASSTCLFKSIA